MGKSIKEKLKEKQEENHEEFRKKILEDINELFRQWKEHAEYYNTKRISEYADTSREMESLCDKAKDIGNDLKRIKYDLLQEIEKLQKERTWKRYVYCAVSAFMATMMAIIICGRYWDIIRSIFAS